MIRVGQEIFGSSARRSAEKVTTLKAMAVAGLAPRRAARPHHSRKPTRWARLGTKMAMSEGTSDSLAGFSMLVETAAVRSPETPNS